LLLLAALGNLAGCGQVSQIISGGPPEMELSLQAHAQVNPDLRRRPSPILVRVYELKVAAAFSNADFVSLYQRDQSELGADLLGREEYLLQPGEQRQIKQKLNAQTRFLGVLAAYRDLERAHWRALQPVPDARRWPLKLDVGELAVRLVPNP
jgi:type VI secretion system protein VasD